MGGSKTHRLAGRVATSELHHFRKQHDSPHLRVDIEGDGLGRRLIDHRLEDGRRLIVETPVGVPRGELDSSPGEARRGLDGVPEKLVDKRLISGDEPLEQARLGRSLGPRFPAHRSRLAGAHRLRTAQHQISRQRHRGLVAAFPDRVSDLALQVPDLGRHSIFDGDDRGRGSSLSNAVESLPIRCCQSCPEPPIVALARYRHHDRVSSTA